MQVGLPSIRILLTIDPARVLKKLRNGERGDVDRQNLFGRQSLNVF